VRRLRNRITRVASVAALCTLVLVSACASAPQQTEAQRAHAIFDRYTAQIAELQPELATYRGDHRYGDRLNDASPAGEARLFAFWRGLLADLDRLDATKLSREDQVSVAVLRRRCLDMLALEPYAGVRSMTVGATSFAFQSAFANLMRLVPVATEAQVEQLLARMAAYPTRVDQEIASLRRGMAAGWVPSQAILREVLRQLDQQLAATPEKSAYYEPFTRLGGAIPQAAQASLRQRGAERVAGDVLPAIRRLRNFVAGDYLAAAPPEGGMSRYPQGDAVYALFVRQLTTTSMTPEEIHALGLLHVERLARELDAVRREVKFAGDMNAFRRYLLSDPRFFLDGPEAVLVRYRDITRRVDPELPKLFAELPRAPFGVRALPEALGPGAAASYTGPSLDGTRPGWFNANTVGYRVHPTWEMESTALHEASPGHHLQSARAVELRNLPLHRRVGFYPAYSEGWALYAETLGPELGMYKDAYSRYGYLNNQAWRAARLVIDTGLHAKGWTRQQAIDYLRDVTGKSDDIVVSEVNRYISWPAQALTYMIGQLKIQELRERAATALGAKFDVPRIHMVLLDGGQLPLQIVEENVDRWIVAERSAAIARR
jgi:uncharacterized protein (DUF885 family)